MANQVYMNRELSWLKFNERVLEEAENKEVPLCERLTFASIFQSNLDEFFMVRVGSLRDQMFLEEEIRENKTNMTSKEQIDAILARVKELGKRKDRVYQDIMDSLENYEIKLIDFRHMEQEEKDSLERLYEYEIAPLISPSIIGKRQPFPFLRDKEIYAVVSLETKSGNEKLGIIPCTAGVIDRLIELPSNKGNYILSEELILHYIPKAFEGYHIKGKSLIRITRNADIDADALYDEDLDYREFIAELIKRRKKLAPIRLEMSREMDENIIQTLCKFLEISREQVFKNKSPLDLSFIFQLQDKLRNQKQLFFEKRIPQRSENLNEKKSIIKQIRKRDRMLSFPYERIEPFLQLLREAAADEDVVSIKMTLYRLAKQSKVVEALIEAAENGKEVVVLVELKARFDEGNNIEWSRTLEEAGCRVIYGLDGYKVHSKLCLITRKTDDKIEYITQIGTGNYNEKTAKLYTDISIMTANPDIGMEANRVLQNLSMGTFVEETKDLLVAPKCLQNKVLAMIDDEIMHAMQGEPAYIGLKLNSLTDKTIIDKLIEASKAGVKIQMIIRGICCLIPGVEGMTENIEVISIVGRFLEHSRIYIFGAQGREKVYIASADFMTRNTLRRVEVAMPVYDERIKLQLLENFRIMEADNKKARHEDAEGNYQIHYGEEALDTQEYFYQQAYQKAEKKSGK